jgi:predicted dehydrogenase
VVITTRHDSHSAFVLKALRAGKHVFVEKPLCVNLSELAEIESVYSALRTHGTALPILMVGFNRRFAPQIRKIQQLLQGVNGPKSFIMTVNAGIISKEHWTQDPEVGGGRIIGEACHYIDLLRFLAGAVITSWKRTSMDTASKDTATLQLGFADGSIGTIHYFANGGKTYPKERLEIFASGQILKLDNFRRLTGYGWRGFKTMNLWRQDKGQNACVAAFMHAISRKDTAAPIPIEEAFEVSRVAIQIASCSD